MPSPSPILDAINAALAPAIERAAGLAQAQVDTATAQALVNARNYEAANAKSSALSAQLAVVNAALAAANQKLAALAQPGVIDVPDGADLVAIIMGAKAGETYRLAKAGNYKPNGTAHVRAPGVTIDVNGSTVFWTHDPAAHSCVVLEAQSFSLKNAAMFDGDAPLFRVWAPNATFSASHFGGSCGTAIINDSSAGAGLTIEANCIFDITDSCSVYISSDNSSILDFVFNGSWKEYPLRYDVSSDNNHKPVGAILGRGKLFNHSTNGKDTAGFRMVDDLHMFDCEVTGDIRLGQTPPSGAPLSPGVANANAVIERVKFSLIPIGGAAIRINQGVSVTVRDSEFECGPDTDCIDIAAPSTLTESGNKQTGVGPFKQLVTSSSTGTVTHQ